MSLHELLNSFSVLFVLLGTFLLFVHSFAPISKAHQRQPLVAFNLRNLTHRCFRLLSYSLLSIAQMNILLLFFLLLYGITLSFYYWYQRIDLDLNIIIGLSILTAIFSLALVALILSPIIFITKTYLTDYKIELRIFRIAIYSVLVPFLYMFIMHDLTLGHLVEGIMLTGLALSFYQIFRGIFYCLLAPKAVFIHWDSRFTPILIIISWLFVIIFNLYTLVLLVSNTDPYSFIDNYGPVTEHLRLFYFTVITFTSVGYGDITPRGNFAVFITIIVSVTGFLYSALFIGGLLAAFTRQHGKD